MMLRINVFLTISVLTAAIVCFAPFYGSGAEKILSKRVVIINSYQKGYVWTDEQSESILNSLGTKMPETVIDVVYMDWKKFPTAEYIEAFTKLIKIRYKSTFVDLLITSDDAAFSFAAKNRKEIFHNAPIVFTGIFPSAETKETLESPSITGVYEINDLAGTIIAAKEIKPSSRDIYLIHDNSETSLAIEDDFNKILDILNLPLKRHILKGLTLDILINSLSKIEKDSIVIYGSYARDPDNLTLTPEHSLSIMCEQCSEPVFIMYTHLLNTGALGGSLIDGNLHGKETAGIAYKVLTGTPPGAIPRIADKTVLPYFDFNVMKRFNISGMRLPPGSIIINKPFSFFERYRILVAGTALAFILLVTLIVFLFIGFRMRKKIANDLIESNRQLQDSSEELLAQNENLQYSQEKLKQSDTRYRLASEAAQDIIWDWDFTNERVFPERLHEILGYPPNFIKNQNDWNSLIFPEDLAQLMKKIHAHLSGETPSYQAEFRVRKQNGDYMWLSARGRAILNDKGLPVLIAGSYTDITEHKKRQDRIDHLAFFDSLTGLPNRVQLKERVEHSIINLRKSSGTLTMLFIDMDNFKYINDSFGHMDGDELLLQAARRMEEIVGERGFVSRLGGDEFIIIIEDISSEKETSALAIQMQEAFKTPFEVGRNHFYISFSMGIASWPKDGQSFNDLLQNADTALYSSKEKGKGRFLYFDNEMNRHVVERTKLYSKLRKALEKEEFLLHYQPQVNAETLELRGFEALIRWNDPEEGMISPQRFIPACEETGQIVPLGYWIFETACRTMKALIDEGNPPLIISVNISVVQLSHGAFVDTVSDIIFRTGLPPENLEIEITESMMMDSFESNVQKLKELRSLGVLVALDDFGTGYSSLNYMRKLPITTLKIDKSFIDNIHLEYHSSSLVNSIIEIAHIMNLEVVAEGVENEEQRLILLSQNCKWIQGYVISKPLPLEEVRKFIKT